MNIPRELTPDQCILIECLAKTDALFAPWRDWRGGNRHAPGSIYIRRRVFLENGVEVFSGEAAVSDRMSFCRRVARLAEAGNLVQCGARNRTVGIRLTDCGDEITRALCDLPTCKDAFETMGKMLALVGSADAQQWVRETTLIGASDYVPGDDSQKSDLMYLRLCLSPGLWRRLVEGRSDVDRRTCYRLTAGGLEILGGDPDQARLTAAKLPRFQDAANARYWKVFSAELQSRLNWDDPEAVSELGDLPLPASFPAK